jgi:hypothetical protein
MLILTKILIIIIHSLICIEFILKIFQTYRISQVYVNKNLHVCIAYNLHVQTSNYKNNDVFSFYKVWLNLIMNNMFFVTGGSRIKRNAGNRKTEVESSKNP